MLVYQINKAGVRVGKVSNSNLPFSSYTRKSALSLVGGHVERAFGSIPAVLRACDSVCELEGLLVMEDPGGDVVGYLSLIKQQEEVLSFLSDNCGLAVQWMEDIVKLLDENNVGDDIDEESVLNVKTSLRTLKELKDMAAHALLDAGVLSSSFDKVELEFRKLCRQPSPGVIQKLHAIVEILEAKNRLDNCLAIYVDVRSSAARQALQALDLSYLEVQISELDSVQGLENQIVLWGKHMEFAVKHVLRDEYEICRSVFDKFGSEVSIGCFAKITVQSGFLALLQFGERVTGAKKDAIKLLKLLHIFAVLDKLRLDFNKVFGGKVCQEIQNLTRDVIKRVVNGACDIFFELSLQVEIQGSQMINPPMDGGIPRFMTFVTNYCIMLFQDEYKSVLSRVLSIHQIWNQNQPQDGILRNGFFKIVEAIQVNLKTWSKAFEDSAQSYFFLMNNYRYLHRYLQGTALGDLIGEDWLSRYEQKMEKHAKRYLKESWGKLPATLNFTLFFPDDSATEELVKTRLGGFNCVFEDMYKRQSEWVLLDSELREKAQELIVQAVVPAYRSFLHKYANILQKGSSRGIYVKYSAVVLETMLRSLFQPKMTESDSKDGTKSTSLIGSLRGVSRQLHQAKEHKVSHSTINVGKGMWIPCK